MWPFGVTLVACAAMERRLLGIAVSVACVGALVLVLVRREPLVHDVREPTAAIARPRKVPHAPSGAVAIDAPPVENSAVSMPRAVGAAVDAAPGEALKPTLNPEGRGAGRPVPTPRRVIDRGVL